MVGVINAVAVAGSAVYVGGTFTDAGGDGDADRIARWAGSAWNSLGSGLNAIVYAVEVVGPNVYVGGDFTEAGGWAAADYVARWGTVPRVYLPLVARGA